MANTREKYLDPKGYTVLFTPQQKEAVLKAAEADGRTYSTYMRRAVLKELIRDGHYNPQDDPNYREGRLIEDGNPT